MLICLAVFKRQQRQINIYYDEEAATKADIRDTGSPTFLTSLFWTGGA